MLSKRDAKSTSFDEFLTHLSAALLSCSALKRREFLGGSISRAAVRPIDDMFHHPILADAVKLVRMTVVARRSGSQQLARSGPSIISLPARGSLPGLIGFRLQKFRQRAGAPSSSGGRTFWNLASSRTS